ncbi:hypothetical protein ACVBGD_29035, partial [Klebsiella pneumoniae]
MKSQPITKHAKALACASALCIAAASAYAKNDEATAVAPVASGSIVQLVLGISNRLDFPSKEMARLRIEQVGADTKWSLAVNWNDQY